MTKQFTNEDFQEKLELLEDKVKQMDKYLDELVYLSRCQGAKFDHIEKKKVKKRGWINIYSNEKEKYEYTFIFKTQGEADAARSSTRIACTQIEWEE